LLRPDPATNNAFLYCLIAAAVRCEIGVLLPCAMSNHYHVVIFDRAGRYPEFIEHFHKLLARSQNALRGRWENFWSPTPAGVSVAWSRPHVGQRPARPASTAVERHHSPSACKTPHRSNVDSVGVRAAHLAAYPLLRN
jgi:hypothetical protein